MNVEVMLKENYKKLRIRLRVQCPAIVVREVRNIELGRSME